MLTQVHIDLKYRNIKTKNIYVVKGFAKHSETEETMVLYYRDDDPTMFLWVRPTDLFMQKFEKADDGGTNEVF